MPPTPSRPHAAPKRAKAKAPPKARPRKAAEAPKGVRFRSRGPHKCTVNAEGKACTGMHKALADAIGTGFDYEKQKALNALVTVPHPPADAFVPVGPTKHTRKLAYSKQQGQRLDQQVGQVVKLFTMPTQRVPLRAFFDQAYRDHFIACKWGRTNLTLDAMKQVKRLRTVANNLMCETEQLVRYLHAQKLTPVSTQTPVASGKVGTQIDLVARNEAGEDIVFELKNGCQDNWQYGKMPAFLNNWAWTQHRHFIFQTLMNTRLYRKTFPDRKVVPGGRLIRIDRSGLHMYVPPQWAQDVETQLAQRMQC